MYWFKNLLEVKDVRKALKKAETDDLFHALEIIDSGLISGQVRILTHYVLPEANEIIDELATRPQVNLTKINVRQLLDWLAQSRRYCGWWMPGPPHHGKLVCEDDLKRELAKRPHVPNKMESRKIRQVAAKNARSGKQRYSHK